jgi:TolB-like protein
MKRLVVLLFLMSGMVCMFAQETVVLDEAIANSMNYLVGRLPKGVKVVVLNVSAGTKELSDYVIEELTGYIVNNGNLTVVDRRNLELLQEEMNFQMSGEVNEDTAQEIGMKLGAQTIISGSITPLGDIYRMRIQAIQVETAQVQGVQTETVQMDSILAALLKVQYNGPTTTPRVTGRGTTNSNQVISTTAYQDFSTGRRVGAGFLNWIFGVGSFTMGDWVGGLIVGVPELVGVILFTTYFISSEASEGLVFAGMGLTLGGMIYGHIRPFQYHRPKPKVALNDLDAWNIVMVPGKDGIHKVQLSYTLHY